MNEGEIKGSQLRRKSCVPCEGGVDPLVGEKLPEYSQFIHEDWAVVDEHHLLGEFKFGDFREALNFTNRVGEIAEQ